MADGQTGRLPVLSLPFTLVSGWTAVALNGMLYGFALPLSTAPFLLAVYLCLGALNARTRWRKPYLNLELPAAPEITYERAGR